jgi:hypothetical protein
LAPVSVDLRDEFGRTTFPNLGLDFFVGEISLIHDFRSPFARAALSCWLSWMILPSGH